MTTTFEQLLLDIATEELGSDPDAELVELIGTILREDGFDSDDEVPEWIVDFFQALHTRTRLEVTEQPDRTTDADVGEFFADLQKVAAFDCYDHGEWVRVKLLRHGMLGLFSVQHAYYTVESLDDIADDGASDISDAKLHGRSSDDQELALEE